MSLLKHEPWEFASLDELLALASTMEQQAIDGYVALSERMEELGHPELSDVFDALVLEEQGHLGKVREWRSGSGPVESLIPVSDLPELFDDEGAGMIAPELLTAYRAFSIAVRNEERAFMFWTYVAANAHSAEIKLAAERMAREELGHVSILRRQRRTAFHVERKQGLDAETDLIVLEARLVELLASAAEAATDALAEVLAEHVNSARLRAESITERAFTQKVTRKIRIQAAESALALCEHLLDCYLDLGDASKTELDSDRARGFAAELIACIRTLRDLPR